MAAVPARLSIVTLGVRDLARSIAFYEAIGWRRSSASVEGNVAFFGLAGTVLGLYGWDLLAEDATVPPDGSGFRGITIALNCDDRAQVDSVVDAMVEAGATLVKPPQEVFWGGYHGYVADPDGHVWELVHMRSQPR